MPKHVREFVEADLAQREPAVTEWIGTWPYEEGTGLVLVWASEPRGLREVVLPSRLTQTPQALGTDQPCVRATTARRST